MSAEPIDASLLTGEVARTAIESIEPKKELRRRSRKADIVAPQPNAFRLPKAVRRLQRNAPAYAMHSAAAS